MSDIVNDDSKLARVRIDGEVNGRSFTVERSTRRQVASCSLTWLYMLRLTTLELIPI